LQYSTSADFETACSNQKNRLAMLMSRLQPLAKPTAAPSAALHPTQDLRMKTFSLSDFRFENDVLNQT
jgi:hypothetical protein